jgi:hypothetical protein
LKINHLPLRHFKIQILNYKIIKIARSLKKMDKKAGGKKAVDERKPRSVSKGKEAAGKRQSSKSANKAKGAAAKSKERSKSAGKASASGKGAAGKKGAAGAKKEQGKTSRSKSGAKGEESKTINSKLIFICRQKCQEGQEGCRSSRGDSG